MGTMSLKQICKNKIIFCSSFVLLIIMMISCGQEKPVDIHSIQYGEFYASFFETGELQAINAYTLLAPDVRRYGRRLMIVDMVEHGKIVKEGDTVIKFDPSDIMNYLIDQETKLEVEIATLNKLLAQLASNRKQLEAEFESTLANYNQKKLEQEKFQFESDKKKEIKKLEFEQAQIRLNNIERKIELQDKISANELKIQQIKVSQREENIWNAMKAKERLALVTYHNGIAQLAYNYRTGAQIRLGDEVWRGMKLVYLPDINEMKVLSKVNETDISKLKIGQRVIIRLDAYPNKPFEGEIMEIGKLSYPKEKDSKIKVFDVDILVKNTEPALKPGMTVSCEFVFTEQEKTYFISNDCLEKSSHGYYIYKKTNKGYERQKVKVGAQNNNYTVIKGSFKEGTLLIPLSEIRQEELETKI